MAEETWLDRLCRRPGLFFVFILTLTIAIMGPGALPVIFFNT